MSPAILHAVYVTAAAVNVIINVTIVFYIAFIVIYFARVPLLGSGGVITYLCIKSGSHGEN